MIKKSKINKPAAKILGVCKLTGTTGPYVDSHLIPKALTKPAEKGVPFVQLTPGRPPVRRWSSWYDSALVTQSGEDILTALDTWAIEELRRRKLIWSSWGTNKSLGDLHEPIADTAWGIRKLENFDSKKLRLFLLSLLWRAAASGLPEFSEISIPTVDLEQLRSMICSGRVDPLSFYPSQLTQLSTIGIIHNHAPNSDTKIIPALALGLKPKMMPIFRFYFDGLIVHFHAHASDKGSTEAIGNLIVGSGDTLLITTQTYEESFHKLVLTDILKGSAGHTSCS